MAAANEFKVPVFFISAHGRYDLEKEFTPYVVPPNTYVFETQVIGDMCLTNIDWPLWAAFQGVFREALVAYLTGKPHPMMLYILDALQNLIVYRPGDTIYNRMLMLESGRGPKVNASVRVKQRGKIFGLYRIDYKNKSGALSNIPYTELNKHRALPDVEEDLMAGKYTTYEDIIDAARDDKDVAAGAMFVFSSCGEITSKTDETKMRTVESHQRAQQLALLERSKFAFGGPEVSLFNRIFSVPSAKKPKRSGPRPRPAVPSARNFVQLFRRGRSGTFRTLRGDEGQIIIPKHGLTNATRKLKRTTNVYVLDTVKGLTPLREYST